MRVEVVQELGGVAFEHRRGVILVVDQVAQALAGGFEALRVRGHVAGDVFAFGGLVLTELDAPIGVVQVQHRVERMIVVRRIVLLDSGVGGVVERQLGVGEVSHEYSFPLE